MLRIVEIIACHFPCSLLFLICIMAQIPKIGDKIKSKKAKHTNGPTIEVSLGKKSSILENIIKNPKAKQTALALANLLNF